ncbi:hypothetical protein A2U01_0031988, partial [Trifolium medium]|nr:hypothetical protein [Trifolium medium]
SWPKSTTARTSRTLQQGRGLDRPRHPTHYARALRHTDTWSSEHIHFPRYVEQLNQNEGNITNSPSIQGEVLAVTLNGLLCTVH